jgi:uncharacterized protein YbjQ (UPF0145 family)
MRLAKLGARFGIAILVAALAAGQASAQRPAIDVRLVEGDLATAYTVVGEVSAQAHQTSMFPKKSGRVLVDEQLRQQAALLGADAVIQVKYDDYNPLTSKKGFRATGRAVKFSAAAAATTTAPTPPVTVSVPVAAPVVVAPPVAVPAPVVAAAPAPVAAPVAATGILLAEQNLSRAYDVLGPVNAELNQASVSLEKTGRQVLDETLRKQAAALGADAVIMIRYAGADGARGPTAIGVAVKYK